MKAQQAYRDANNGLSLKIPNDIFKPSHPEEETKDELSIFSGKTHTLLTTKSTSSSPSTVNTPSSSSNKSRSSSDSPQLVMPDNPSFKGVHPSLVSELNVFNGFIKRQLENAYKAGGEVFGGGEPMVVDSGDAGGAHRHQQPTQMHAVRQHQPTQQVLYQPDYQRQHFDKQEAAKRLERDREEAANREMERQEMEKHEIERQELARQQQLHQQREIQRQQQQHELLRQQQQAQQQEIIQQQQQLDIRRQQEKQQQMQGQYRQQLDIPQHQLQQRRPSQYHVQPYDHDQPPMVTEPDLGMVTSSAQPAAPPIVTVSHSQAQRNVHHPYQRPHHYQSMHHLDTGGVSSYVQPQPPQRVTQRGSQPSIRYSTVAQQQHSMYAVPPEYSSSPDSIQTGGVSYVPPSSTTSTYLPPTPISTTPSPSSYAPHWSGGSYTFAMPDQQASSAASSSVSGSTGSGSVYAWANNVPRIETPEEYQHQQYTPEGALRGIAADDRSLQETWQSYMNKVHTYPHHHRLLSSLTLLDE